MRHPALLLLGPLLIAAFALAWIASKVDPLILAAPARVPMIPPEIARSALPPFMLRVGTPGKTTVVPMGITAERAIELAEKWFPKNMKLALRLLGNVSSELGEKEVEVQSFYLASHPVTNGQYLRFVQATGVRPPFHWWKHGEPRHFKAERPRVLKAFPNLSLDERGNAGMYYWEFNWKTRKLPYSIPLGTEKHPVVFVSLNDAIRCAAWAGMRLPTEPEWTLAANGGKRQEYVFGDRWRSGILTELGMASRRDIKLKPVGALGRAATGPFGHLDMVGQVWEWVIPLGFEPQIGSNLIDGEYKNLLEDKKYGKRIKVKPHFKPGAAIAKGGSFLTFSDQDFVQARIGVRAPLTPNQTLESLGFRLARTDDRAAYGMSLARLKFDYPTFMPGNIEPDLSRQVGIERYELESGGEIIKRYHAVSAIPATFLALEPGLDARKLRESFMRRPALVSILITTEEVQTPALNPGVYGVFYRPAGFPSELLRALNQGHRELVSASREKARVKAAAKAPGKKKPPAKPAKWRAIVQKYGYSLEEIEENEPSELVKHVYVRHTGITYEDLAGLSGWRRAAAKLFKVSTEKAQLLFRSQTGKWVAAVDTDLELPRPNATKIRSGVAVTGGNDVEFTFGVMQNQKEFRKMRGGRELCFRVRITLRHPWH